MNILGHKVTFNLPATTNTYHTMGNGGGDNMMSPMGPSTPESPFSPEIQNILDDGGMSAGTGGSGGMSSVFRSHSVPVQDMIGGTGRLKDYCHRKRIVNSWYYPHFGLKMTLPIGFKARLNIVACMPALVA